MKKRRKKKTVRWVVKAGSNMVCGGGPLLIRSWMQQVGLLQREHQVQVIWVTSGAIASAVDRTQFKKRKRTLPEKQALSAIGQPMIMDLYNLSLQATGLLGAQILLTYDDLADSKRRGNFLSTVETLLDWGVTPILNENDAVATEEIRFGDNDSLSAKVARFVGAERLVILTDVSGLYEEDPRKNPQARQVFDLNGVDPQWLKRVDPGAGSARGTGGMFSKLRAADEATRSGVETWLVQGDVPSVLIRVATEEVLGTRIRVASKKRSTS
jgi:glutamate 5-kinase